MSTDSNTTITPVSKWTIFKKKMRKVLYLTSLVVLLFLGIFIYWKFFYTYSDGYRAGLLQKFSHKGTIFKTFEGELILSSVAGRSDVVIASEKFLFSVTDKKLASHLDTLQGRNVIVHYVQKNAPLMWKGDTPYYVDSVRIRP
jgi:hypothetical protein